MHHNVPRRTRPRSPGHLRSRAPNDTFDWLVNRKDRPNREGSTSNQLGEAASSSPKPATTCSNNASANTWTLNGRPLPYTKEFDTPEPTDNPAAVIPVQEIRGPVFLDCGGADKVWTSCPYARAIMARLASHNFPYPHVLYAYPRAGHFIDFLVPYEPLKLAAASADVLGAGPQSNQIARASLWPHILSFLASWSFPS